MLTEVQSKKLDEIVSKLAKGERLNREDGLYLFTEVDLGTLGKLADSIRREKHGNTTYYNKNFHIEPTNVCVFSCKFCSYSKLYKNREDGWELSKQEMLDIAKKYGPDEATEVHIVGGVHPKMDIEFFAELISDIKKECPHLHIKGFTAVELDYMFRKAKMSSAEGMKYLHDAGLQSLPGGGAEIFDPEIREKICADKCDGDTWLDIHRQAHLLGMPTNCTMLYGHYENYEHRLDHMEQLRTLQDETQGFNCFIPLKFRNYDNEMSHIPETSIVEDLKMYAVARLYMDNIPHLKAYWPMLGRETAQLTQSFGVNDLDGTIDDSTKIYSLAGSEEQFPSLSSEQLMDLITSVGFEPKERNSVYDVLS